MFVVVLVGVCWRIYMYALIQLVVVGLGKVLSSDTNSFQHECWPTGNRTLKNKVFSKL